MLYRKHVVVCCILYSVKNLAAFQTGWGQTKTSIKLAKKSKSMLKDLDANANAYYEAYNQALEFKKMERQSSCHLT